MNTAVTSLLYFPRTYQHALPEAITTSLNFKHEYFQNSFFHPLLLTGIKLDHNIRNFESNTAFENLILKFIKPSPNSTFNANNPHGIELLTRLRYGLSHLLVHKFRHNCPDFLDPFCNCRRNIETAIHFSLHGSNYSNQIKIIFNYESI